MMSDQIMCPFCQKSFELNKWIEHQAKHEGTTGGSMGCDVPLGMIRTDAGTQSRVSINAGTVKEYAEAMATGDKFPALSLVFDRESKTFILVDGFHRLQAAKVIGIATFESVIRLGTLRDAVLSSKGANPHHGLSRTVADKRKVVTEMLQDPEWVKWSDREIAKHCAVSNTFVGQVRGEIHPKPVNVDSFSDNKTRTYKTATGKVATMKTGNISSSNKARTTPPRKSEDTYQEEVESVNLDDVGAGSSDVDPKPTSDAARPHPAANPDNHPLSGTTPKGLNGGKAPVIPALLGKLPWTVCAEGDHWNVRDAQGATILVGTVAGDIGEKIAKQVVMYANNPPETKAAAQEPVDDSIPFNQINSLNLHIDSLNELIKQHGKQRVAAVLRYIREMGIEPVDPLEYIRGELESVIGKKPKGKGKGKTKEAKAPNPNAPFIVEILATYISESGTIDPDIYAKAGSRNQAEKLHTSGVKPSHVQTYIRALRQDKFWHDKAISLDKVLKEIIPWLNAHCQGWNKPVPAETNEFSEYIPQTIVPLDQAWKQQRTGTES